MADRIILQVTRYLPEQDETPTTQDYEIPLRKDWSVLDALNHIKDHIDGTLSYRWSCRMGICGSCGMTVDGEPKLACATFLTEYAPGPVRVEPLSNFPVVRDLVVEIGDFMNKLSTVKPWIIREDEQPPAEGEYLQTPTELAAYQQYSMCINCMLCYSACPVYGLDSRDQGGHERLDVLSTEEGVWDCTFVGECTTACPKHVDPAGAIQRYKVTAVTETLKSFLLPRGKR